VGEDGELHRLGHVERRRVRSGTRHREGEELGPGAGVVAEEAVQ
jgi:hypothetical protein